LGGAFAHEVGIGLVIFSVGVCGAPGFLMGIVGGGEECLWHGTKPCPGVNGEGDEDHVFSIQFTNDIITMDERCGGGGGFVHTSKFTLFMMLKVVVCIGSSD
jgi:hypothetical protein